MIATRRSHRRPGETTLDKTSDSRDRRGISEQFERAWSQALLAVSTVEEEATRVAHWISGRAGSGQEDAKKLIRDLSTHLAQQRKALEATVEDAARKAMTHVRLPKREELQRLTARLDRVAERAEALARKGRG